MALSPTSSRGTSSGSSLAVTDGTTSVNPTTVLDLTSGATVTDAGAGQANVAIAGGSSSLTPTATKSANYSATAGQYVPVNATATITLPSNPANGTQVGVENISAANTVTVAAGAGDTIDTGGTSASLTTKRRAAIYVFRSSDRVWLGLTPLSDAVQTALAADASVVVTGTSLVTVATGTLDAIATAQPPAAAVPMNAKKITGLAIATAGTDAASLANTLDQFGAPAASVAMNSQKLTGLAAATANGNAIRWEQSAAGVLTASGDVVYASAANTLARLAKGSDGQVLTLASGLPSWAAAAAGGSAGAQFASFRASRYTGVPPLSGQGTLASGAITQSTMYLFPVYIRYAVTVVGIGVSVAATVASSNLRVGIYNDGGAGIPTSLVVDAGVIDTHTSTGFQEVTLSQALAAGLYWFAAVAQAGASNIANCTPDGMSRSTGAAVASFSCGYYTVPSITGALPDPAGTMVDGPASGPRLVVRIS